MNDLRNTLSIFLLEFAVNLQLSELKPLENPFGQFSFFLEHPFKKHSKLTGSVTSGITLRFHQ